MQEKSSVETIRAHFDTEVERFSNADTGQTSTMDSALVLDMVQAAIGLAQPGARRLLDIGCGAGNFSLRCLRAHPGLEIDLADLSRPMLDRAGDRIRAAGGKVGQSWQGDVRELRPQAGRYDLIVAAAVLHHLRSRDEWRAVLAAIHGALAPGGSFWYWDLVRHDDPALEAQQRQRWSAYLEGHGGAAYRDGILASVEREDSPESTGFIMEALRQAGFPMVDVIHKNGPFAALMARKAT
jgi:tRNA (cmo5U34)-methyltransferase